MTAKLTEARNVDIHAYRDRRGSWCFRLEWDGGRGYIDTRGTTLLEGLRRLAAHLPLWGGDKKSP
jgi:hypothetical protein